MSCPIISLVIGEYDNSTSLLTDSKEEQIILLIDLAPVRGTQSWTTYLKQYNVVNPTKLPISPSTDPALPWLALEPILNKSKPKEVRFDKSL